jgi:hypothetical protein
LHAFSGLYFDRVGRSDLRLALNTLNAKLGVALHRIVRLDSPNDALHSFHDVGELELRAGVSY